MSLVWMDSCGDHYSTSLGINEKWSVTTGVGFTTGRTGSGNALSLFDVDRVEKHHGANYTSLVIGFAVNFTGLGTAGSVRILSVLDVATEHIFVTSDGAGHLRVTRSPSTVLGTGTTVITLGIWYYLELKFLISDTVGTVELRLNGVPEIGPLTSQDTRNAANASVDRWRIGNSAGANGLNQLVDDVYVLDPTVGSAPTNDFLGDVRVEALLPNGNGNSSQLVGSDGNSTDNYLLVDETAPNSDTDYVESGTVGEKDTYAYGNLVTSAGTVYGVQPMLFAKKTNVGSRSIASVARLSGTEVDGPNKALTTTYDTYYSDVREAKPGGGVWTISDVNSAEFGVKVTA